MQQLASYLSGAWQTRPGPRPYYPSRHHRRGAFREVTSEGLDMAQAASRLSAVVKPCRR